MKRILLIGILLGINSYDAFAITERKQYDQQHDFIPQLCPDLGRNQIIGLQQAGDQLNIDDRNWRVVEINPIGQPSGVTRIDNITTNNNPVSL